MFTDLAQIFSFSFNSFALLSLLSILINLFLIILINVRSSENEPNRWFRLLLTAIVLWGFSEFLGRVSLTPEASQFWGFVGRPGWVFIPVLLFAFSLSFVGKDHLLRLRRYQFLIFGPALLFLFLSWNTNLISNNNISDTFKTTWGWDTLPVADYFWIFVVWLEAFLLASVAILFRFYLMVSNEIRKKQTILIIIALLVPIIGGSITDAILPIFDIQVLPVAILLTSVMSVIVTYALLRYGLFVVNPTVTANTIIDTMSEALLIIGNGHIIEQVNKATLNLLGFKSNELVGQSIRKIIPDVQNWDKFLKRVIIPLKKKAYVHGLEVDFRTKEGKLIPVSFSAGSLIEKGKLLGIVALARDVRETRILINRLTAERNKVSVAIAGIVEGLFAVDKQGRIILFNPAMERMLETGQDEAIGRNADEVIFMTNKENRVSISDLIPKETVLKDQVFTIKKNIQIIKKDGTSTYGNVTSSTIAENEEINLGAIITIHDISQEHELEEMKLDFVSMAAHELRTPLTSIRGYLSVLQDELVGKIPKEHFAFLQKAFISSSQLASLVENLLSVSRIERGRMKIEKSPIDWVELVQEVVGNFIDQARQKGVDLKFDKPTKTVPKIYVDRFRMSEVLSNLIGNAINYTEPGGKVTVSAAAGKGEIVTSVKDTGQGIPKEALPKLFTKFFRVSGVLEQGSKGTGLGLYISKAIVEMHSGNIWVNSILGRGSTFSFALPITKEVPAQESKQTKTIKSRKENGRKKKLEVSELNTKSPKRVFIKNGKNLTKLH